MAAKWPMSNAAQPNAVCPGLSAGHLPLAEIIVLITMLLPLEVPYHDDTCRVLRAIT